MRSQADFEEAALTTQFHGLVEFRRDMLANRVYGSIAGKRQTVEG